MATYWTPLSLWCVRPETSWPACSRVQIPISSASRARSVRSDFDSCQPTTRRENTSMTNAAYTQPANVQIGRASCRERGEVRGVDGVQQKKERWRDERGRDGSGR